METLTHTNTVIAISEAIINQFYSMNDGADLPIWDGDIAAPNFSWFDIEGDHARRISRERMTGLIYCAVIRHLQKHDRVLLYVCRDNEQIGLEADEVYQDEQDPEFYHADIEGLPDLYIGWD